MLAVAWDPAAGREATARFGLVTGRGYVSASQEAAGAFVLQAAFAGEKVLAAAGVTHPGNMSFTEQAMADGVILTDAVMSPGLQIVFGDSVGAAVDALAADAGGASAPQTREGKAALCYLANLRAIRLLVQSRRAWSAKPDIELVIDMNPSDNGAGSGLPFGIPLPFPIDSSALVGELGNPVIAAIIVVGVVGSIASAAYAWIKHDTAVEAVRQSTALEIERVRVATQAKLAADLAAQALAAGQAVSIPDVVASLGRREYIEERAQWWIAGGLAAAGLAAGGWAIHKRRALSSAVAPIKGAT